MYKVQIDKKVLKELRKIDKKYREKIIETIEGKIAKNPYIGKKLLGELSDFYRYRVGDYRIIYLIFDDRVEIEIVKVGHRKEVYE